ncbi:MAG: polyribonucleotide nucleotidyltransferase [Clostridiaceae bacterium]|nr:polyribonucleotide nucleotidyltransferase [Clostridiaceae bacterium]
MKKIYQTQFAGRDLIVEIGELAQFANGSCLIRYGDTVILSTATASVTPREGIDFFPLSVDYEEKMYSVGKIPGGFIRREGRPSEKAVLTSRVIDRSIRPLFPKDLRNDVVVNNLVLSVDQDHSPEILAMVGTSIAISTSDIPWDGPIGGMLIGLVDGKTVFNPTEAQRTDSAMHITLAGTKKKIAMIEAGANEVADAVVLDAIIQGHGMIRELCDFIDGICADIGKPKFEYVSKDVPEDLFNQVKTFGWDKMRAAVLSDDKSVRDGAVAALTEEVKAHVADINAEWLPLVGEAVYKLEKKVVRDYLFREHRRVDGRPIDAIRPLSAQVGVLPRVHGSGLFQRGQTQVLTSCTLAPMSSAQKLDGIDPENEKRYIHHYNFPPYSVGEARAARSPGRREIGHGALAERSLIPVLPAEDEFPYAIRLVSEVLMSNGSTSQGSVCASTLALMDAGVPIKRPVAGISAGLIVNEENEDDFLVFMDIQGIEDFFGDMDFKVAGTTEGITSIQMDIKVDGLSYDIVRDAFEMTRKGRLQIINDIVLPCIASPREELSRYAPKILQTQVPVDKIREVIGAGGKVINKIIAETGTQIDIEEDGRVYVAAADIEMGRKAIAIIEGIVNDPEPGQVFEGRVTRLMTFGAFVEFAPGKEGLVHISKMAWKRVEKVEDVVSEGDPVKVMVTEVDSQGRINLSMRDCLPKPEGFNESESRDRPARPFGGPRGEDRRPRGDDRRPRGDERRDRPNDRRPGSGYTPRHDQAEKSGDAPEGGPKKHTRDF